MPEYIRTSLNYINDNFGEKIISSSLADYCGIERTTLLTAFKKYTGMTLNEYLIKFRLKKTTALLNEGATLQSAAEKCGFNDSSNFIQSFKRYFGSTPVKCINNISDKNRYAPKD